MIRYIYDKTIYIWLSTPPRTFQECRVPNLFYTAPRLCINTRRLVTIIAFACGSTPRDDISFLAHSA